MASDKAREVAKAVLDDLGSAAYYRDPDILAGYLAGQSSAPGRTDLAKETARAILDDLRGAGYYRDPEILAQFLEGRLALS